MKGQQGMDGGTEARMHDLKNKLDSIKPKGKRVKKDIQNSVDRHIQLHAEYKSLEKELKALREEIESYMDDRGISKIEGSHGGSIELQPTNRAPVTARYSSYELDGVVSLLDIQSKKQCIVPVVDKDVLEFLVKTGKVPKEVSKFKLVQPSVSFRVNHI